MELFVVQGPESAIFDGIAQQVLEKLETRRRPSPSIHME